MIKVIYCIGKADIGSNGDVLHVLPDLESKLGDVLNIVPYLFVPAVWSTVTNCLKGNNRFCIITDAELASDSMASPSINTTLQLLGSLPENTPVIVLLDNEDPQTQLFNEKFDGIVYAASPSTLVPAVVQAFKQGITKKSGYSSAPIT